MCRFNVKDKGLKKDSRSEVRNVSKRIAKKEKSLSRDEVMFETSKLKKLKKKDGRIYLSSGTENTKEEKSAQTLRNYIGGNIVVKKAPQRITKENENISYPDYDVQYGKHINTGNDYYGESWDETEASKPKYSTIKNRTAQKSYQIRKRPGGIIIKVPKDTPNDIALKGVRDGMHDSNTSGYRTIIMRDGKLIGVYKKHKKKKS